MVHQGLYGTVAFLSRPLAFLVLGVAAASCAHQVRTPTIADVPPYPATRTVPVVDDYHGTRIADPYRWLEDLASPEVRRWASAQTALAERHLQNELRGRLLTRMMKLGEPWDQLAEISPTRVGGFEFRLAPAPGNGRHLLTMRRVGAGGEPRVLIDPKTFGDARSITRFQVSPDARYVAYALSSGGSEWVETRIRRVADGQDLPETVDGLLWTSALWTLDGRGFFYVHHERPRPGEQVALRDPSVRYHVAGTPQASDRVIFRTPNNSTELMLETRLASEGRYLLVSEGTGANWADLSWVLSRVYVLDLRDGRSPDPSGPLVPLTAERDAGYRLVASEGPVLYLLTDRGAPRKRLVAVDLRDPAPARWRDVIPESADVLQSVRQIHRRFVAVYLADVQGRVEVFDRDGRLVRRITLPPLSTVLDVDAGEGESELRLVTTSFLRPPAVTRHDLITGAAAVVRAPATDFDTASYEAKQIWYRSKDGTRVPMFVLHRKGIALDGSHPTLLYGYGASGTVKSPIYSEEILAWLELGGIYAAPSLRGGGEFGRAWYEAAILERKQRTFDDFIAAAEWLIAEGYTSPAKLAIQGASNGGLLVAATMTQRPDLFAVAIAEVPLTDNLRYDRGRHRAQFGFAADPAQFPFLYAYSPLHRVKPGTCYPATLITTALNDDRAPAWHAMKFAAAVQAAQSCARPVLLRAHTAGGHGSNRGPNSQIEDAADVLTFAARNLAGSPTASAGSRVGSNTSSLIAQCVIAHWMRCWDF